MFDRGSVTLFRVRSVPIRAHWTLLLVIPYLAFMMAMELQTVARTAGVGAGNLILPPLMWGALLAVALFASVAVHELAHTLLALRFGGRVRSITLMLLGGVSQVTRLPQRPRYEGLMAVAGPLTSLALGGLFVLSLMATPRSFPGDVRMALFYLAYMNIMLGIFNLLPAFPLDGGRVLRAILAARLGQGRATRIAANVGRVMGAALAVVALLGGNLLLLLVAVFIFFGAGAEEMNERMLASIRGLRAGDLVSMLHDARAAVPSGARQVIVQVDTPALIALDEASEAAAPYLVVTDTDGRVVGILPVNEVQTVLAIRASQQTPDRTGGAPVPQN
jgi:Zn-dependent protease